MKRRRKGSCPISYSLDIFGDKWTLLILRDILLRGKSHYGDFLASPEKISTNILADRLESMLASGLLLKKDDPENWRQTVYSATPKALALRRVISEIAEWGLAHGTGTKRHSDIVK